MDTQVMDGRMVGWRDRVQMGEGVMGGWMEDGWMKE